jgi:phage tail-like protein
MIGDPLAVHRFFVTLDPSDAYLPPAQAALIALVAAGEFSEVKGLGGELEVMPYSEGGVNDGVHQLPVRHSWGRITLSGGVGRGPGLWAWYQSGLSQSLGARRDGAIVQLAPDGAPAVAYHFRAGLAASWTGPDLSGLGDAIAIESLQIAHEGLLRVPVPGIG